jgi:hypothetical protein
VTESLPAQPGAASSGALSPLAVLLAALVTLGLARFAGRLVGLLALLVVVLATVGVLAGGLLILRVALR